MFHSDMNGLPRGELDYGNFQNAFQKVLFIQHSPSCKVSNHGFQNVLKRNDYHFRKKTVQLPWLFQRNFSSAEL